MDSRRKRETDLIASFATPIPIVVIAELLGVPREMAPQLLQWSHDMVAMYQARRDAAIERKAVAATRRLLRFHARLCQGAARAVRGDDLLSQLIAAEAEGRSSREDELITTAILLLNAGHEATVHAIGNGVKALLEKAMPVADIGEGHIEEALRFDAPLASLHPLCAGRCRLWRHSDCARGRRSACCSVPPIAIRRASPNPIVFDPARTPNPHVSFGAGIHFCVGAPLARLELERRPADPVRAPAGLAAARNAALPGQLSFPWAGRPADYALVSRSFPRHAKAETRRPAGAVERITRTGEVFSTV